MPQATLNRTVLPAVKGVPAELVGRTAYELLGMPALAGVEAGATGTAFLGRRVGALLAGLRLGDPRTGLGLEPSPWRRSYLEYWREVRQVTLGGGTAQRFGADLAETANRTLRDAGVIDVTVRMSDHAALLPLIGAARSVDGCSDTPVLDFGHSLVKRGTARYDTGALTRIELLPAVEVDPSRTQPREVVAFVREVVQATAKSARGAARAVASVAAYLSHDDDLQDRSYYRPLVIDARERVGDVRADAGGANGALALLHDGSAAARAVSRSDEPSTAPAAVLMLGTALGLGFVPDAGSLVPVSADFHLVLPRASSAVDVATT